MGDGEPPGRELKQPSRARLPPTLARALNVSTGGARPKESRGSRGSGVPDLEPRAAPPEPPSLHPALLCPAPPSPELADAGSFVY